MSPGLVVRMNLHLNKDLPMVQRLHLRLILILLIPVAGSGLQQW